MTRCRLLPIPMYKTYAKKEEEEGGGRNGMCRRCGGRKCIIKMNMFILAYKN